MHQNIIKSIPLLLVSLLSVSPAEAQDRRAVPSVKELFSQLDQNGDGKLLKSEVTHPGMARAFIFRGNTELARRQPCQNRVSSISSLVIPPFNRINLRNDEGNLSLNSTRTRSTK